MAGTPSPVTPAVVAWALQQDSRSVEDLAALMQVEPAELLGWADGSRTPTVGQVSALAVRLQRPRVFFFLPAPPASAGLPSGFRRPPGSPREVSQSVLLSARRARRVQRALAATMPPDYSVQVPAASVKDNPVRAADRVRAWLGAEASDRWKNDRVALQAWRRTLDEAGVFAFMLQLGQDQVRGFAAWDDKAPMVVVNTSGVLPAARLFTLGHELAHLVLRQETACDEPAGAHLTVNSTTERWCERFAAALLMPAAEVSALMAGRGIDKGEAGVAEVTAMTHRFRISGRAAAVRLDDLGWAAPGLYPQVLAVFVSKAPGPTAGQPHSAPVHEARVREYGAHTIETLMSSLPPRDAMDVLRIDVNGARDLAEVVPGVVAI